MVFGVRGSVLPFPVACKGQNRHTLFGFYMAIERTLSIIKPDAVAKNVIGQIVARFEKATLTVNAASRKQLSRATPEGFSAVHKERPFLQALIAFINSGPGFVQV